MKPKQIIKATEDRMYLESMLRSNIDQKALKSKKLKMSGDSLATYRDVVATLKRGIKLCLYP